MHHLRYFLAHIVACLAGNDYEIARPSGSDLLEFGDLYAKQGIRCVRANLWRQVDPRQLRVGKIFVGGFLGAGQELLAI